MKSFDLIKNMNYFHLLNRQYLQNERKIKK